MSDTRSPSDHAQQLVADSERDREQHGDVTYYQDVFVHVPTGPRPAVTGNIEVDPIWEVRGPQYPDSYVTMHRYYGIESPFRKDTLLDLRTRFQDCVEHLASGGGELPSVLDPEVTQINIDEETVDFLKVQMAICDDWKTRLNIDSSYEEYKAYDRELTEAFQKYITRCSELIVENHPLRERIKSNVKAWDQLGERMRTHSIVGQLMEESQVGDNLADKDLKRRMESVSKPSLWVVMGYAWTDPQRQTADTREPDLVPGLYTALGVPICLSVDRTKNKRASTAQQAFMDRLRPQVDALCSPARDPESNLDDDLSFLWDEQSRKDLAHSQYDKINARDREFRTR